MVANLIDLNFKKLDNYPMGSAIAISAMAIVVAISLLFLFVNRRYLKGAK